VFPEQYVWLIWSLMFLIPWIALYIAYPGHRKAMLWAGVFTTPFGLTEPIFVPEYWSPPSLFDLARTTGFDLESLLFCFGIGGTAAVLYNLIARSKAAPMPVSARTIARHRYHYASLATPFVLFPLIYFFPWNPIYPGIVAMAVGAFVTALCRPDLKFKIWIGGLVFTAYYLLSYGVWSGWRRVISDVCGTCRRCPASTSCPRPWKNSCSRSPSVPTGPEFTNTSPGRNVCLRRGTPFD
jgi:hypothetical protein